MTREELRRQLIADCDFVIQHAFLSGAEKTAIAKAVREQTVKDDEWVDRLVTTMNAQGRTAMSFDPATLEKLLTDAEAAVPGVVQVWQDVLALFAPAPATYAKVPVKAVDWKAALALLLKLLTLLGPFLQVKMATAGCSKDECLHCALHCAIGTVQALLQAECC